MVWPLGSLPLGSLLSARRIGEFSAKVTKGPRFAARGPFLLSGLSARLNLVIALSRGPNPTATERAKERSTHRDVCWSEKRRVPLIQQGPPKREALYICQFRAAARRCYGPQLKTNTRLPTSFPRTGLRALVSCNVQRSCRPGRVRSSPTAVPASPVTGTAVRVSDASLPITAVILESDLLGHKPHAMDCHLPTRGRGLGTSLGLGPT